MGSVNVSIDYAVNVMKFGHVDPGSTQVVVDNTLLQGGIVSGLYLALPGEADWLKTSVYYLGCLVGCMLGGWIAEKVGRIKVIALGAIWGVFGASLQCSAQNSDWMICGKDCQVKRCEHSAERQTARLINGIGTGMLNVIVPVWVCSHRPDYQAIC